VFQNGEKTLVGRVWWHEKKSAAERASYKRRTDVLLVFRSVMGMSLHLSLTSLLSHQVNSFLRQEIFSLKNPRWVCSLLAGRGFFSKNGCSEMVQKKGKKELRWQYVNCTLSSSERKLAMEWGKSEGKSLWDKIHAVCEEGFKLTIVQDATKSCFTASLTAKDGHPNFGWTLSAKEEGPEETVTLLLYKHLVFLEGNWQLDGEEANYG